MTSNLHGPMERKGAFMLPQKECRCIDMHKTLIDCHATCSSKGDKMKANKNVKYEREQENGTVKERHIRSCTKDDSSAPVDG